MYQNVTSILQYYHNSVALGYTALWFKKVNAKVQMHYLDSDKDLNELVKRYKKYKKGSAGDIMLININNKLVNVIISYTLYLY